ncbi:acetyl-CoA carboxylase biotin carboxyl carrier protein subunit [Streptomyces sp. NBS 14/10]|uniref:acetyl-CoA carboxylase biotin carboxyl carrier protein n=1 Tax=Streptomyces sp. NBS 14/10 TaxID=1945643 RepID=UPI000B7E4FFA|nr:biotin/lipoyl-containing protein [Streptomyces sp. NBS 14/10]KAK1183115.1 acetyl-CoA carboxylase biotin carboxyl carrier protein subunit [Streptomyces sp. NBS 14/10]
MTADSHITDHRENGHRPGAVVLPPHATLDSLCRSVTELAKAADKHPRRITLRHGQTSVEMEWPDPAEHEPKHEREHEHEHAPSAGPATAAPSAPAPPPHPQAHPRPQAGGRQAGAGLRYICASTVGTFYHAPEPGAPPFIGVGDMVKPGQPVGVLEVMKMMSTIESDAAGRVVEILVPNAQPVEYQQPLIAVEPGPAAGPV